MIWAQISASQMHGYFEDNPCLNEAGAKLSIWLDKRNELNDRIRQIVPYQDIESQKDGYEGKDVESQKWQTLVLLLPDNDVPKVH